MINVGVIGYGYWGPNLVRNIAESPDLHLSGVCDLRANRRDLAVSRYPSLRVCADAEELINDHSIDALAIATPVSSHFPLSMAALKANKHVFVEKPLTEKSDEALQLIEEAERRNLVLMVDHTFVYTPAVRKIKELIDTDDGIGNVYYYDSVRVNLGLFQHDVNVIYDLAVHDLSILDYLLDAEPRAVSATGVRHFADQPENIAYLTVFFDNSLIAHIHVNWLAPVKLRSTLIGGSRKMIVYDDLEPSEKIRVYDKGITVEPSTEGMYQMLLGYRTGDMWAPRLETTEALKVELAHFHDCIMGGEKPLTSGRSGLRVVSILEAAVSSLKERGRPVELVNMSRAV